jgi:GH15 family glucan-1,4-alpha-glucosidase
MVTLPIEDYAMIGDMRTAALVSRHGSIDWLCLPRFDSGACFASLLGTPDNGYWKIAPRGEIRAVTRRYREGSLVLETELASDDGLVRIIDCMPPDELRPNVVRLVEGVRGKVAMRMELVIRFDYGWIVPWVRKLGRDLVAIGGPDAIVLHTPVAAHGEGLTTIAEFTVAPGDRIPFCISWFPSHLPPPEPPDSAREVEEATAWWRTWSQRCTYRGPYHEAVLGSLVTLKGLTYDPTGGIVAAATTSLPERIGGVRHWDYRYVWLRDATFTLYALMLGGYTEEARAWREWLLRAAAGTPTQLQVLYGVAGERRLPELSLDWLAGYAGSRPVRTGNAAQNQLQLDIFGEVIDTIYTARTLGDESPSAWAVAQHVLEFLETARLEPDEGIWEVRGPRRHFTHSKMMVWVAFDRAVKAIERLGLDGPLDRWRALRDAVHTEVCQRGFDPTIDAFTQSYGSRCLDASLLMMPLVGFLPVSDPRVAGTVRAIERGLMENGLVHRYDTAEGVDGLPPGEGAFLPCSFWLADNYVLMGRLDEARVLFARLLALRNDVGLLAEEYDPVAGRMLGNFPQAFSHVGLVNTAYYLTPNLPTPGQGQR